MALSTVEVRLETAVVVLGARASRGRLSTAPCTAPPRQRRSLPIALGLLLAGVLGGACSRAAPELILPVSNWPGYEYFYLAELNDLAAAEGLRLRTAEFPDPQAIVHAFLRGELQLAQLTTVEAVDICSRAPDRCPVVVLVLDESRGGDQVAARPGIGSLAELRGRRVGLTLSTLGPYVLSRALEQAGLSLDDVEVRTMPLAAIGGSALWLQWRQGRQLSVSITSWPANEYLYLAEQKQLGKPFGIDLRVTQSSSLADQRLGFVNGDVVNRHRKLRHFRHRKVSHPRPGLGPCFRSGSALAASAVPLFAHGFRVWLRWLSSVIDAGGAVPAVFPSDLLGWRRWRLAADAY